MRFAYILFCFVCFYSGRLSYTFWRNRYLDEKQRELLEYHERILKMAKGLKAKDNALRKKWQDMVVDMSTYEFSNKNSTIWTDRDDQYLESWYSAEK